MTIGACAKNLSALRHSLRRFFGNSGSSIGGIAATEFAFIAAILMILMICTIDLGYGFYRKIQVQNAAQAGAQYAMLRGFDASAIKQAVINSTNFSAIKATPEPVQFFGCPLANGVETVNAGSTCADGSSARRYVMVSSEGVHKTILIYPLIPESFTFTSQSTVRIQ